MTYIRSTVLPSGDVKEIRTNPGAAPQVYINGVRQPLREPGVKRTWVKWFAWRPVKIKGKWVIFKWVYRYQTNTYLNYDDWSKYEYGDLFDVLADSH